MLGTLTPITRNLIILNVLLYTVSNFLFPYLYTILPAYYPFSPNFRSWQIVTHMFMHASFSSGTGIAHILFNMLTLWSFGPVLESYLKEKRFLILYFASGLGAFLLFNLWNFFEVYQITQSLKNMEVDPTDIYTISDLEYTGIRSLGKIDPAARQASQSLLEALTVPMLGASGAIFGVIAAFSTLFPNARLFFMFIPFPIKAKYLFPIIMVISLYLGLSSTLSNIAHFAHIGGAIVGFFLAKIWNKNKYRIQ
ncbi:MAG: rhomboid family intramembrane serine protease [Bergeyella sp.]|nr:rhomboid family intramembrane serine protease [Bergeyella sp.]